MEQQKEELIFFSKLGFHPLHRNSLLLLPKNEVQQCSEKLLQQGIRILGYEGFILENDKIKASLESIADYSTKQPILEDIRSFLESADQNITHFEISIDLKDKAVSRSKKIFALDFF